MSPVTTKVIVLEILRQQGTCYGIEIMKRAALLTGHQIEIRPASLYPALQQLEEEGLIEIVESERRLPATIGGRPRIYDCLTDKGQLVADQNRQIIAELFGLRAGEG